MSPTLSVRNSSRAAPGWRRLLAKFPDKIRHVSDGLDRAMPEAATTSADRVVVPHLPWIASVTWFGLVALKALRVAHLNTQTAIAILGSSEVVSVAFFVLVALAPLLLVNAGFWVLHWMFSRFADRTTPQRVLAVSAALLLYGVGVFVAPWPLATLFPLGLVVLGASWLWNKRPRRRTVARPTESQPAYVGEARELQAALEQLRQRVEAGELSNSEAENSIRKINQDSKAILAASEADLAKSEADLAKWKRRRRRYQEQLQIYWIIIGVITAINVFVPLLTSAAWRPAERLALSDGSSQVGYVVGEGDWTTVLMENPRRIVRIKLSTIESRTVCQVHPTSTTWTRSIVDLVGSDDVPRYPQC